MNIPFDGEKSVRTVGRENDRKFFEEAKNKLGFKKDIDFLTFCASIALIKECKDKHLYKRPLSNPKKLVGMETFEKRDIYDLIIRDYLDCKEDRLKEFDTYFYTGFNILRSWFTENDPDLKYEIERFSELWNTFCSV